MCGMYICVCVHVCKHEHARAMAACGGQRTTSWVRPHLVPCLRQDLFPTVYTRVAGPQVSGPSPVLASHLAVGWLVL